VSAIPATDWAEWTAIGTLIAAGAAIVLGAVTAWLVVTTRRMVSQAGQEIAIERQRIDAATKPRVFPAPTGNWGNDNVYVTDPADWWRNFFPVTNGGPGVALNVKAQLRRTPVKDLFADTMPTSLGPGESRDLVIGRRDGGIDQWPPQIEGALYYNDVSGALWETNFRIYEESNRYLVEVQATK
jgi:hypothetical protein